MMNPNDTVRYIHIKHANITLKFVLENGWWVCRTTDEFINDVDARLRSFQDDLK